MKFVVAIDGTSSSGKTTTARLLAKRLKAKNLDTGAMYRCVTLGVINNQISIEDDAKIKELLSHLDIQFKSNNNEEKIFLNGKDVTLDIRSPEVDRFVSQIAKKAYVREKLVKLQREMAKEGITICEGRDIGTVVFPDANLKIFMTASLNERARRRFEELRAKNTKVTFEEVKENLKKRDRVDTRRKHSPLKKPKDALLLDTTKLTIEEQVKFIEEKISALLRKK